MASVHLDKAGKNLTRITQVNDGDDTVYDNRTKGIRSKRQGTGSGNPNLFRNKTQKFKSNKQADKYVNRSYPNTKIPKGRKKKETKYTPFPNILKIPR